MEYPFKNLVFKGGGVLGVGYQGAYEVLEENGILPQVEKVCGTSTGAISALFIALEYKPAESRERLMELNFKSLQDDGWRGFYRIFQNYGWYKGDNFLNFFKSLCKEKIGDSDATFADLHRRGLRQCYFIGTNLTKQTSQVFCYENTPDFSVAEAVRISISVPYYFAARTFRDEIFVDGGVLQDYAIQIFDEPLNYQNLQQSPADSLGTNHHTLGLYLDYKQKSVPIHNLITFAENTLQAQLNQQQNELMTRSLDVARTIFINTLGMSPLDFRITTDQKIELMEEGRKAAKEYLKKYQDKKVS